MSHFKIPSPTKDTVIQSTAKATKLALDAVQHTADAAAALAGATADDVHSAMHAGIAEWEAEHAKPAA